MKNSKFWNDRRLFLITDELNDLKKFYSLTKDEALSIYASNLQVLINYWGSY